MIVYNRQVFSKVLIMLTINMHIKFYTVGLICLDENIFCDLRT